MPTRGNNKGKCKTYKDFKTREKNKIRKLKKHLKKHLGDNVAKNALNLVE